jgi:alkylation response protein AidB-like acyl-CoA dehydrogenase
VAVDSPTRSAEELRDMTRRWLAAELPPGWMEAVDAGDDATLAGLRAGLDYSDWCVRLGEAGYATPTWPAEYGAGLSLSPGEVRHVNEVLSHYKIPRPFNIIGIGMGGPTVMAWGTEEMKHRLLRPLACNQEIWCQLFSEPGAGSDVAGLATRAVRDGDEWVVNGQKVWTTVAQYARWGMLLCRTNPDVPKHGGLSYFVIDMEQPGVEVRPLVQITGDAEFNEVFFSDARVRHDWMLGREGDGWKVAITTLMNERVSLSGAGSIGGDAVGGSPLDRLLARHRGIVDPLARQRLAQAYIESRLIRLNNQRAADKRKSGAEAGPEGSITKLQQAEFNQRLQKLAVDLEGAGGVAWEGSNLSKTQRAGRSLQVEADASVAFGFLRAQANTIEGGTSDIMRNILGERVLGLPKEPDHSREMPWSQVPRSA